MLKIALTLNGTGTLVGSTSGFILTGEATFSRLQLYAPVGSQTLHVKPTSASYDPELYHAAVTLNTLPCATKGMEEKVVEASPWAACVLSVCAGGCLSDYGYCRDNFCICTAADREGINCGLKKGSRDAVSLTLPSTWVPNAVNRDKLLSSITASLNGTATAEFRSYTSTQSANSTIQRRGTSTNVFTFALLDTRGQYIESKALATYGAATVNALPGVVSGSVSVNTVESPKVVVASRDAVSIVFMVLAAVSIATSVAISVFLVVYRDDKAVKASSILFSQQIIFGVTLGYALIFLDIGEPTKATCISQVWVGGLAFTLAVGNLIGKNWRIYKIFTTTGKSKAVKDKDVLILVMGIMLLEIAIDAIWTGLAPLEPVLKSNDSSRFYMCDSDAAANSAMTIIALTYKVILLLIVCGLAFLTRGVDVLYSESKAIGVSSCKCDVRFSILIYPCLTDLLTPFYRYDAPIRPNHHPPRLPPPNNLQILLLPQINRYPHLRPRNNLLPLLAQTLARRLHRHDYTEHFPNVQAAREQESAIADGRRAERVDYLGGERAVRQHHAVPGAADGGGYEGCADAGGLLVVCEEWACGEVSGGRDLDGYRDEYYFRLAGVKGGDAGRYPNFRRILPPTTSETLQLGPIRQLPATPSRRKQLTADVRQEWGTAFVRGRDSGADW
ncbi:7 transmembrane sweet-taste receptor of 3 GCPR-domain-containing protein [Fimicolochytrium jonesii]|uniref:7 transmembrane sweet-taste receptor of 3 GCPR-domain-containing protein n=1 Tax=Fimicolochytrium jonesii TaxID=1396493 RepID=UPI0022FE5285|nr:7 transmembrane sweet-taste receptor of 3 GCPR-domain-containing protein [Fimicolochytrium jonesii]KAI8820560.1 7 transmembrane sweet-taste receptor of 3 GCPR-domain-containing protein [Fimicolochytrium jonesii]